MSFYSIDFYGQQHGTGSAANNSPKYKFKFYVEFGPNSVITELYNANQYQYLIKSVTKPKPSVDTADSTQAETRTWFGNIPDPTKRNTGTVSWSPITIKFANFIKRHEKSSPRQITGSYQPPDDENPPTSTSTSRYAEWDLEHFFSRMIEDMDSSMFGGSAPKPFTWSVGTYDRPEDAITAWLDSQTPQQKILYATATLQEKLDNAKGMGYLYKNPNNFSNGTSTASTINKSTNCKTSMDSYMKASCICLKFFGDIKIYDLINNSPVVYGPDMQSSIQTFANGYWTLRNPWIKSVDFGNHDYASDELQEYSVEIAYESARYVPIKFNS